MAETSPASWPRSWTLSSVARVRITSFGTTSSNRCFQCNFSGGMSVTIQLGRRRSSARQDGDDHCGQIVAQESAAILGQGYLRFWYLAGPGATSQLVDEFHDLGTAGRADG